MTARRNHDIALFLFQQLFVFLFNDSRADCRFLNIEKSELFEGFAHSFNADALIIRGKGRRKAYINGRAALQKNLYLFGIVLNLLCVLRADNKALSAENALVSDNMRLISREAN